MKNLSLNELNERRPQLLEITVNGSFGIISKMEGTCETADIIWIQNKNGSVTVMAQGIDGKDFDSWEDEETIPAEWVFGIGHFYLEYSLKRGFIHVYSCSEERISLSSCYSEDKEELTLQSNIVPTVREYVINRHAFENEWGEIDEYYDIEGYDGKYSSMSAAENGCKQLYREEILFKI